MVKIAWSIAHGEFTLEDGYYFSHLKRELEKRGAELSYPSRLEQAEGASVLVLNYPELPFSREEVAWLLDYVERGGRLLALAYYNNEDHVAEILNGVTEPFGVRFLYDGIRDPQHHLREDPYLVVTRRSYAYREGVSELFMPYSAPVTLLDGGETVVEAEPTALSDSGERKMAVQVRRGRGRLIAIGTCVFWDNYALPFCDNLRFALNLLGLAQ